MTAHDSAEFIGDVTTIGNYLGVQAEGWFLPLNAFCLSTCSSDARTKLAVFFSILLVNQMMVDGIANQFGGGCELQLILETASIGTDGLDAENEGLRDVLERLALG
jgi:hypothetical protein